MSDHLPVVMELETDQEIVILNSSGLAAITSKMKLRSIIITNELEIRWTATDTQWVQVQIFNVLGQEVFSNSIPANRSSSIDVSHLASGMYYLHSDVSQTPLKFVKQ